LRRKVELFVDHQGFLESPRWHEGRLWVSDFITHRVSSIDLAGDIRVEAEIDDRPSGLGWLPDGRMLVVAMQKRLVLRREPDGALSTHADLSGVAAWHANDMVVGPDGTAYVGNLGSDLFSGEPMRPSKLATIVSDGTVSVGGDGLEVPNGSVITPDARTLIVGESYAQRYTAFPIARDGSLGTGYLWARTGNGRNPDGCTLDAELAIWYANCLGREVVRIYEGGEVAEAIELRETAWACALGGEDGRTLYVLTGPMFTGRDDMPSGGGRIWTVQVDVPHAGLP
jgi:sugar lactone lactonase YvrE